MSSFIKGGIVTRIDIIGREFGLDKYFNLNLYDKNKKSYLLKGDILNNNISCLRKELLELTNNNSDSIDESDAYVLLTTGNKLLEKNVHLTADGEKYYYEDYVRNKFETVLTYETLGKNKVRIYFLPVLWIVDKIWCEDDTSLKNFLNKMVTKSLNSKLGGAFFITMIN